MKSSKAQVHGRFHKIPKLKFKTGNMTSYAGAVILQVLFGAIDLRRKLEACFQVQESSGVIGRHVLMLMLVLHLMLGFRRLRSIDYYRDDVLIRHMLGLRTQLPDVSTLSRNFGSTDPETVDNILGLIKQSVHERIQSEGLRRVTIDYDGSVVWTKGRSVEGTAAGFNKTKKGAKGYYPLLATCAQTGQVVDLLFRPGNVHDSNGAFTFALENTSALRAIDDKMIVESRLDSAFFSEHMVTAMRINAVEFTISVPFERFVELKNKIETRKKWKSIDETWSYFEDKRWRPRNWNLKGLRFLFIRQRSAKPRKGPIQLDLYIPQDFAYEYKVIVTNKTVSANKVLVFHNGRGSQEGIIGELKAGAQFDYIPFRRKVPNKLYMCASVLAHNLSREMQMATQKRSRGQTDKRSALWDFRKLATIRHELLLRAGKLNRPGNELTLTVHASGHIASEVSGYVETLKQAA